MNWPNRLTLLRIGMTFLMVIFLTASSIPYGKTLALIVFGLAGLSDYLDGFLARSCHCISTFGQLMDPMADKILICAAFVSFVAVDQLVPAWMAIIVISREFLITGLRLLVARDGKLLSAGKWGKHKMIWQTILIVFILVGLSMRDELLPLLVQGNLFDQIHPLFVKGFRIGTWVFSFLVTLLTLISGLIYFWENRALVMRDI